MSGPDRSGRGDRRQSGGRYQPYERSGSDGFRSGRETLSRVYVGNLSWDTAWQDLKDHMRQAGHVVRADVLVDSDGRSKGCGVVEYGSAEDAQRAIDQLNQSNLRGRNIFVRQDREHSNGGGGGGGSGGILSAHPRPDDYRGGYSSPPQSYPRDYPREYDPRDVRYSPRAVEPAFPMTKYVLYPYSLPAANFLPQMLPSPMSLPARPPSPPMRPYPDRSYPDRRPGPVSGSGSGSGGARQVYVSNLPWSTSWQDLKDLFRPCGSVMRADVLLDSEGRSKGAGVVLFDSPADARKAIERMNGTEFQGRVIRVQEDKYS